MCVLSVQSSHCKQGQFYFFPCGLCAFYFRSMYYCFITMTGAFSIILSQSDESGHPCLVLSLQGKILSLTIKYGSCGVL